MFPGNLEESLIELGFNRNIIRPAREYYGSKLPYWILSPMISASMPDHGVVDHRPSRQPHKYIKREEETGIMRIRPQSSLHS